jgi:ferredoxin
VIAKNRGNIMIKIIEKAKCCGCGACVNVCPKQCIEMQLDNEGFLYPVVDENQCVECNLCDKVCPLDNSFSRNEGYKCAY